jgi:hypothetical protein
MRTTLTIDDDIYHAARSIAKSENKPIGRVISILVRKGLSPPINYGTDAGFPMFLVAENAPPITPEMVRQADEDA